MKEIIVTTCAWIAALAVVLGTAMGVPTVADLFPGVWAIPMLCYVFSIFAGKLVYRKIMLYAKK